MDNKQLLETMERTNNWVSNAVLELRELDKLENKFTPEAVEEMKSKILTNVQLTISEMEILSLELGGM